jgi:hypothetical protein
MLLLPAVVLAVAATGCGGDGSYRVSGKVTFNGKPVPGGKIYFMPDGAKGNKGTTGYADIKDGAYDTSSGVGAPKGAVVVAIEGVDPGQPGEKEKGVKDPGEESTVKSLFPRWETTLEVTGGMTKDFDVPAEAGKPKPRGETQFVQP